MILMPCAPRRIAFCIARFIARRNMMRFSSCCVIESAISCASISGLRISSMLTCTGTPSSLRSSALQVLDVLALLADHHARTRRVDRDARVLGRALDQRSRDTAAFFSFVFRKSRTLMSSASMPREVLAVREPARRPVAGDRQAEAGRMDLLSHDCHLLPLVADRRRRCGRWAC